jgi:hypothetical protein
MSMYTLSVTAFIQVLSNLSAILDKAEAHAAAKNIQPEALLNARLYPDMFPLTRQVQSACDFAAKASARLAQVEVPNTPNTEQSFAELKQRVAATVDYLKAFTPAQFEGSDARDIEYPIGPGKTLTLSGEKVLAHLVQPNFYFHAVTAYDILRHNGLEVGKRDFLGAR